MRLRLREATARLPPTTQYKSVELPGHVCSLTDNIFKVDAAKLGTFIMVRDVEEKKRPILKHFSKWPTVETFQPIEQDQESFKHNFPDNVYSRRRLSEKRFYCEVCHKHCTGQLQIHLNSSGHRQNFPETTSLDKIVEKLSIENLQ